MNETGRLHNTKDREDIFFQVHSCMTYPGLKVRVTVLEFFQMNVLETEDESP